MKTLRKILYCCLLAVLFSCQSRQLIRKANYSGDCQEMKKEVKQANKERNIAVVSAWAIILTFVLNR